MTAVAAPVLPAAEARAVLAAARGDVEVYAAVALLLLAGLRPQELERLRVVDYTPGEVARLRVGGMRLGRWVRVARSAAAAVDALLAASPVGAEGFLLSRLSGTRLVQAVRAAGREAGVDAGVHDLRKAAAGAALAAGLPTVWVQRYFGMFTAPEMHDWYRCRTTTTCGSPRRWSARSSDGYAARTSSAQVAAAHSSNSR
jgi:integrase